MTAPVYIIEGPDGAGKTHLAHRLIGELELCYPDVVFIHNTAEDRHLEGSLYRHYRAQLMDAIDRARLDLPTVIDRSALSEFIYGTTYRGKSRVSQRQLRKLERLAQKHGVKLIKMTAPLALRQSRIENRGETFGTGDILVGVKYNVFFRENPAWKSPLA